jgi:DNA-directed RNA polymerase specialized sigma24 family protein
MTLDISDADILTLALAGCNAAEVGAYMGIPEHVADARISHVLHEYANPVNKSPEPVSK